MHILSRFHFAALSTILFVATGPVLAQQPSGKKVVTAKADTSSPAARGAASPSSPGPNPLISQPMPGFRVGIDDELTISVWHEPELSQAVVVRPDGMITLPLINDVAINGLTTEEVQTLLTEKLKPVLNEPQVTVIVKAVHSRKVFLVGNALKQGQYPLSAQMTVLELLAEAGGLGPFAKKNSIYVLRNEAGKQVRLRFDYKKALSGKGGNPELQPGDMVVVP